MKKSGIFNKALITAIADMGHRDIMIIGDAGTPIPRQEQRIDLAISEELPTVKQILELVMQEMIYEEVVVTQEQKNFNPLFFKEVCKLSDRCEVETVTHEYYLENYPNAAKYIVRTGGFEPWGNVVLVAGIDAPKWFKKDGVVVPDYYKERVEYKE